MMEISTFVEMIFFVSIFWKTQCFPEGFLYLSRHLQEFD